MGRYRIPALFCALAVLVCELISRPYANMGVCDDMPYIQIARTLAATGHILYNGPTTPMLGWQIYLGAAFIRLFGFSPTTVRMSTLLIAMALAFVLQRTLVRANISERNATIGTLAFVLSPLYLVLSVTFMTDIPGLFAIVVCLYGCLRAVQATTSRAAIGWLCFAVAAGAICGTTRQIAWLGVLVIMPSTLWLLRSRRSVLLAGIAATIAGDLFIFACLQWFKHQPYNVPEHLLVDTFSLSLMFSQLGRMLLDGPFLLLPIVALFLPGIRKSRPRVLIAVGVLLAGYIFMATFPSHLRGHFPLDPVGDDWVGIYGMFDVMMLKGQPPILLSRWVQVLLTVLSIGGVFGLICSIRSRKLLRPVDLPAAVSWNQLGWMLGPMVSVYLLLLIPRAGAFRLIDRYLLPLLVVAMMCMVRFYQEYLLVRLPSITGFLIGLLAIYGIVTTHNTFAVDRGRVALAEELRAAGVPDTAVDGGWEYNQEIELRHSRFINDYRMVLPKNAYVPAPPLAAGTCDVNGYDLTPHIRPLYGISFDPNVCYGPAPFAPVTYSEWLATGPGTLYVVYYTPSLKR